MAYSWTHQPSAHKSQLASSFRWCDQHCHLAILRPDSLTKCFFIAVMVNDLLLMNDDERARVTRVHVGRNRPPPLRLHINLFALGLKTIVPNCFFNELFNLDTFSFCRLSNL